MRDISIVAEQLRTVRQAARKFMNLWTIEQCLVHPALDRMAADVEAIGQVFGPKNPPPGLNGSAAGVDE